MLNLILFGPPGSGKGTQSAKIARKYNLRHISTGDIFRNEIKNKSPLGLKVQAIIEKGDLVPDDLLLDILKSVIICNQDKEGCIFDGFPRTIRQAMDLDEIMKERKEQINGVLALEVDEEEIVTRLLKRAQLEGRKDDTEVIIRNRLQVYYSQTRPLLDFYNHNGLLREVTGVGSIDDIFNDLCFQIDALVTA
jgi:adenylate kinase